MKQILSILLTVCLFFSGAVLLTPPAQAAATVLPTPNNNLSVGLRRSSSLVATSDGYMRVYYDGSKVGIEYYDDSFNIKSKKSIAMELSIWGGFYAGSDAYYLVEGQNNTAESNSAEVIRVIKYDKDWNKTGTAKITGNVSEFGEYGSVRYPFDYGCVEMTEYNDTLYLVTGHEGYVDPAYNQGHQGFLMIAINKTTMTGKIVDCDLWHSFAQYIETKGTNLYFLEQSEGSRYTKLSKYDLPSLNSTSIPVLRYGGVQTSAWAIPCYATVDGLALSSSNVLSLGTSIDQSRYDEARSTALPYNIYLTVTPMSNFTESATTVKWLTNYTGNTSFYGTKITKINDNRFMVSWEVYNSEGKAGDDDALSGSVLHYVFVDGNGNKLTSEFTAAAPISDCQPIVKGSKIVYYASGPNMVNFYTIDSTSGQFSKKVYRIAGENATWELKNGVLTISGNGGKIPERAFAYNNDITEVVITDGVTTIGKEAFYGCNSIEKITIPASVTSIGDDILWTGYTWVGSGGHVVYATIYAPAGSTAITYAKNNNISYELLDEKPAPVTNLKATPSTTSVALSWTKSSTADSYQVDVYKNGKWTYAAKISGTSYTITGLTANTEYKFRVYAYKGSAYSSAVSVTATTTQAVSAKPAAVTNLKAIPSTTSVALSWTKSSTADSYQVDVYKDGKWTYAAKISGTSYTVTGLTANTEYKFRVFAYKGSEYSSAVSVTATTKAASTSTAKPTAVTGLKATPSTTSVALSWTKNSTADSYQVDVYKNGKWTYVAKTTGTSYTVTGLSANTSYKFRVFAFKGSAYSSAVSVTAATKASSSTTTKPTAVTGLKATPSTTSVKLSWTKNSTADSYQIDVYKNGKWTYVAKTTGTSYTVSGLSKNTSYKFRVFAFKGSAYSSAKSITAATKASTSTTTKPTAVTGLKATPSTTSVKLSWTKNSTADSYQIDVYKNGKWTYVAKTTGTSYTVSGLSKNTSYKFRVFAFKGSAYSSAKSITASTSSSSKPTAVTGLKATPSTTSVKLSWNKNSTADSYQIDVYKDGKWTYVTKTTGTSYTVSGLSKNTSYKFRVFAFKGSAYSSAKSITAST